MCPRVRGGESQESYQRLSRECGSLINIHQLGELVDNILYIAVFLNV
jgi:hypothetical protein